jgi:uncharacterized coiled-coil DUF342 family protein
MTDLLLHNLRTIGTHHCDGKVGEEAADEIERLRETVKNLRESAKLAVHYHADELADVTAERDEALDEVARLKAARFQFSGTDAAEITRLREQLHLAEVARAAQVEGLTQGAGILRDERDALRAGVAGLREALLQCGESGSIFDVRSIVRGALAARKGAA